MTKFLSRGWNEGARRWIISRWGPRIGRIQPIRAPAQPQAGAGQVALDPWTAAGFCARCVLAGVDPLPPQELPEASGGTDALVQIWEQHEWTPSIKLESDGVPVVALAFAPDGNTLAVGDTEQYVRLWRAEPTGQPE